MKAQFKEFASQIPDVRKDEVELYERYLEVLREWNEKMNLVSKNSLEKAFASHFVDSIAIAEFGKTFAEGREVSDLGSGAGFPGLIYAIRYPNEPITLYEKIQKKQAFLAAVVERLDLKNVRLQGPFPDRKVEGLFLARAVMKRAELFTFFSERLTLGSRLITNLGGQTEATPAPRQFSLLQHSRYTLPLDCGDRQIEAYEFVR